MNIKTLIWFALIMHGYAQSFQNNVVPSVTDCWKYGYCVSKKSTPLKLPNKAVKDLQCWHHISFEKTGKYIILWRKVSEYESQLDFLLVDTMQIADDTDGLVEFTSKSHSIVKVFDTKLEVLRGYGCLASHYLPLHCTFKKGTYPTYGNFFFIPEQINNQEKNIHMFTVHPYEHIANLGAYGMSETFCFNINSDGKMIAFFLKDASLKILKIAPCLQPYSVLRKTDCLHDLFLYFA